MSSLTWYLARSAGLLSWALVTASVLWGLALSGRVRSRFATRPWLLDLHRFLGGLAVVFTLIHVTALIADSYISFSLTQVLVPFTSTWRPGAVAWGIVAVWLLIAVEVTSLLKQRLSRRHWHTIHLLSYLVFLSGTVHGLTAGTDTGLPWLRGVMCGVLTLVVILTGQRIVSAGRTAQRTTPWLPTHPTGGRHGIPF